MKTKKAIRKCITHLTFFLFLIPKLLPAQCISGDCANGKGKAKYYDGIYEGEFKDSLPHGKGEFVGKRRIYNGNTDSLKDVGMFYEGIFMKGKRSVLASWSGYPDNEFNQRFAAYPKIDGYFIVPEIKTPKEYDYPTKALKKWKSGKKEISGYDYGYTYQGKQFSWYGDLSKGLMDGEGLLVFGSLECVVQFEKGMPVGPSTSVTDRSFQANQYLKGITFANGKISELHFYNQKGDSLTGQYQNLWSDLPSLLSCDGFFKIKYKNGDEYKGEIDNGTPSGAGKLTYSNGTSYQGYFYNGYAHGWGAFFIGKTIQDSGFYVFNKLLKGTALLNDKYVPYPVCVSGDCENGYGKVDYSIGVSASKGITNIYEGNFVNGVPFGFGEYTYQNGDSKHSKRGTFSAGQLMGEGTITADYGELRKITGNFNNDSLLSGTIEFSDGTKYIANKMTPIVFGIHTAKSVSGNGTYITKKGSTVTGDFYSGYKMNKLFKATYRSPDGVTFDFDYNYKDIAYVNGVYTYYDIDELDYVAERVLIKKAQAEAEREYQRKAYAYEKERREKQAVENAKEKNWKEETRIEKCSVCDGVGYIIYHNSVGNSKDIYKKGNYISGPGEDTWRYMYSDGKCRGCTGKGKVTIKARKYIGPTF